MIPRLIADRPEQPTAAVLDARTVQGSVESGARSGYDGHKKRKGAKVHLAVDTPGHLLAAHVSAANENERAHVDQLLANVQEATGESVEVALRGFGLPRRSGGSPGRRTWHDPSSGWPARSQEGLRTPAPALGGRTLLRLDCTVSAFGA